MTGWMSWFAAVPGHPAGHVLAVEQVDGLSFSPGPVICFLDRGSAYTDPFERRLVRAFHFESFLQLPIHYFRCVNQFPGHRLGARTRTLLPGPAEAERAIVGRNLLNHI